MNFNNHSELEGLHAFLSPSKYHWINYDNDKLKQTYANHTAAERGSRLHAFASECINLGIKLPRTSKTINMFVNDAIGYKMNSEQVLYYSVNCFGTADAISFRKNFLRIHDYKSGITPASPNQLLVYAAIFCLEYNVNPNDIDIELRIYQSDEVVTVIPEKEDILYIMQKIIDSDKTIEFMKAEM